MGDWWNDIQNTANNVWNGAETTVEVTKLIARCSGVVIDIAKTLDLEKIRDEFKPMLKEGLTDDNLEKIFETLNLNSDQLQYLGDCVGETGDFAYNPQWNDPSSWIPWGRTYEEAVRSYERSLQAPHAISISIGASVGKLGRITE